MRPPCIHLLGHTKDLEKVENPLDYRGKEKGVDKF
jgi:hypothetical protein